MPQSIPTLAFVAALAVASPASAENHDWTRGDEIDFPRIKAVALEDVEDLIADLDQALA